MSYLGNFDNLDDERNDNVVVTNYEDFRKIVCASIRYMNPRLKTDEDIEKYIDESDEGIVQAMYSENKKNFAEGRYVYSKAAAAAMNLD